MRLRGRRMEERRRKREAAATERAARAKARKAAWQTQLETGAAAVGVYERDRFVLVRKPLVHPTLVSPARPVLCYFLNCFFGHLL